MRSRPFVRPWHLVIEAFSFALVIAGLIFGIVFALRHTEPIPTHFSITGEVDGYGSSWVTLTVSGTMLLVELLMAWVVHFCNPKIMNVPVKLTESNSFFIYRDCITLNVVLMLIMGLFSLVNTLAIAYANGTVISILTLVMVLLTGITIALSMVLMKIDSRR